jgi:16S rRNA processing protein RimM
VGEATDRLQLLDPGRRVLVRGVEMKVESRKGTAERPLLKLEGVDDRSRAERLRGEALEVPRAEVGTLAEGEFLVDDLVGCHVVDGPRRVGTVSDVLVLPGADTLEVERGEGPPLLIPLVADAVRTVDPAAGRIDVDMAFVNADGD